MFSVLFRTFDYI